jgi:ABC-2 type transport system permease protein
MKIFWSFARQSFHNTAVYRFDFWLQLVGTFLMMYSVYWIWKILYAQNTGAFGVSVEQMITYGALGMALETIFHPGRGPQFYMASQLKTGAIDTDLLKPLDFHVHMLARNFGELFFRFVTLSIPAVTIGIVFLDVRPPVDALHGGLFLISLLLGFLVLFSLNFLLGMLAVITLDIRSISWAYNGFVRFFSGQMVPLWLFPGFLAAAANALPFKSIYFIPISIYIGQLDTEAALQGLLFQAIWFCVLMLMGRLIWSRVHAKLVVQGG